MEIFNLQHYLQHYYSNEEIAEEFGFFRSIAEREVTTKVMKKESRKDDENERTKKLRPKSKNSSR